jgi:hypothetical protein
MLIGTLSTLTACVNHKRNYFIDGRFESNNLPTIYHLEVNKILKDEYDSSNFLNVVEDKVLKENKYFRLKFYAYNENEAVLINIVHLHESNSKTQSIPVSYSDDNEIIIIPYYPYDLNDNFYYLIIYGSSYLYFDRIE